MTPDAKQSTHLADCRIAYRTFTNSRESAMPGQSATAVDESLWSYLEEKFIPTELKEQKPGTADEYRKAMRKFVSFAGVAIRPTDVAEFLVERWLKSMILNGVGYKTATAWATYVRRVVRSACPDRCHKKPGKRPHEERTSDIRGMSESELLAPEKSLLRFFQDHYVVRRMIGCKQGSIDQKRWTIGSFAKFLGRAPIVGDLCDETVSKYLNWLLKVQNRSAATANDRRRDLVSLWNFAVRCRLLLRGPDVDKVRETREIPKAWTIQEFETLLQSARNYKTRSQNALRYPAGQWFECLFLVAYDTGLRLNALLSIRLADWKPDRREVTCDAEFQKTRVAQTFQVSEQTASAIQGMLAAGAERPEKPEFLFDWPMRRDSIHPHMRKILKAAGLYGEAGDDTFHRIRKTSATHLTAALGIEAASRQLGHSSIEMTRRYVDVRQTGHHNAADHLPRPKRGT